MLSEVRRRVRHWKQAKSLTESVDFDVASGAGKLLIGQKDDRVL